METVAELEKRIDRQKAHARDLEKMVADANEKNRKLNKVLDTIRRELNAAEQRERNIALDRDRWRATAEKALALLQALGHELPE